MERVEIKDVKLPLQLQRAMAAEAEATREARAKVRPSQTKSNAVVHALVFNYSMKVSTAQIMDPTLNLGCTNISCILRHHKIVHS